MSIGLRLSDELEKRLEKLSKQTKRSKSYLAREALEQYIEDMEDYIDAIKISKNLGKTYTLDEVIKRSGLED